jgi:hypothetical protein
MASNAMLESPNTLHYFATAKGSGQSVVPDLTLSFYDIDLLEA